MKVLGCETHWNIESFYIFITGWDGAGNCHLIKTDHMALIKVVMYKVGDPERRRILLLAPNGVAAINISRTSIHSGLRINVGSKLYPLRDRQNEALGNKLSEFKLIIID